MKVKAVKRQIGGGTKVVTIWEERQIGGGTKAVTIWDVE